MNILFLCTGNTSRSPMAEAIMRHALEERGVEEVVVSSAGTGAFDGAPASEGAYLVALASTPSTQIVRLEGFMCNDPGSTGTQQIAAGYLLSTAISSEQMTAMAVNSTVDQLFSLAAVGPATDAITLRYFMVEVLK